MRKPCRLLRSLRVVSLSFLAAGLVGCGGTIYFGHSSTNPASDATVRQEAGVDQANCRLPVVVMREVGPPYQFASEPGFVNTGTGQYLKDGTASIADLPDVSVGNMVRGQSLHAEPAWYDETAKRWLPTGFVAPDGQSYLWYRLLPAGSNSSNFEQVELHRFDLTSHSDQRLWSFPGEIDVDRWDGSGIHVHTFALRGGLQLWLIDPRTSIVTQQPPSDAPRRPTIMPGDPGPAVGIQSNALGGTVYRIGGGARDDPEWVFYESAPGQRVTIYKGRQGDATGFDPSVALTDETGVWFSDNENLGLWHWDRRTGLRKIAVTGLPDLLLGPNAALYVDPAGSCM